MPLRKLPDPAQKRVIVLVISPFQEDHSSLRDIFAHSNWNIYETCNLAEAIAILRQTQIPVIICERDLPDGNWTNVLNEAALLANPPHVIVTARLADEHLWAEVLNLGGYDLLEKPFQAPEVFRVISLAWLHWNQEWERANQRLSLSKGA